MSRSPVARWFAVVLVAVLALHAAPGTGETPPSCDGPGAFAHEPSLGPACRADGGWHVLLRDGSTVFTHGHDPPRERDPEDGAAFHGAGGVSPPWPSRGPACVANPDADPHVRVLYARSATRSDLYASTARDVERAVYVAGGFLRQEALRHGYVAAYPMLCDASGARVLVGKALLPTPLGQATFGAIVSDLRAMGHDRPHVKYWVYYHDAARESAAGIGTIWFDDRPGAENKNNEGPSYAVTYSTADWFVMVHENGHNMGAVQSSAPQSTWAGHCRDGLDVMCYADGGRSYSSGVCPDTRYDCNSDDYFHPSPAAGSYLATHWNIGSPVNRWLRLAPATAVPGPPTGLHVSERDTFLRHTTLAWTPPAVDGGSPLTGYVLYRGVVPDALEDGGHLLAPLPVVPAPSAYALDEVPLVRLPAGTTTYQDEHGFPSTAGYSYRVAALNANGASHLSNRVLTT